jgi:predicted dehydrogenase
MKDSQFKDGLDRRQFLVTTAVATTFNLLDHSTVFGMEANGQLELGLIGCGGRGSWIADLFVQTGKYRFVACADYFQDRVDAMGAKHGIAPDRRYTGLSGHKRLLDSQLDAVVIETPPYFHPQHAAAAIGAGKHVFLAKPVAVDVPGCQTIAEAAHRATAGKLVFLVDFQTRANSLFREALRRIRQGDLGPIVMVEACYPSSSGGRDLPPANPEERLRNWYHDRALCGDFIVEQAIHALDVATWVIDADPRRALGLGGQILRPKGSIWDHFSVNYEFANGVPLSFTCVQTIPDMRDQITCRAYGGKGYFFGDYFGSVWIRGNQPFASGNAGNLETELAKPNAAALGTNFLTSGNVGNLYLDGAVSNILEFHRCITEGHFENPTALPSVRSNLTAVLGREAAYQGGELTFADLLKAGTKLEADLTGVRD